MKLAEGRTVYLPEGETVLDSYQYLYKDLDSDNFINALFSDPSRVQKNYISTGEEFTDGQSLMRENLDSNMIYYVDPAENENVVRESNDLLKRVLILLMTMVDGLIIIALLVLTIVRKQSSFAYMTITVILFLAKIILSLKSALFGEKRILAVMSAIIFPLVF